MSDKYIKRFELCAETLKTLEDVKKVLKAMKIRIDVNNPLYEDVKDYFVIEVMPPGYLKLFQKVGPEEFHKMSYDEVVEKSLELANQNEETN